MPIGTGLGVTLPTQGGNEGTWGSDLNNEINKIVTAVESPVPITAIDASADLSMQGFALTSTESVGFIKQSSVTTLNSVYFDSNGEFVVRDGSNNIVQLTVGGALNTPALGGLGDSGATYGTSSIVFDWDGVRYNALDGATSYCAVKMSDLIISGSGANTVTHTCGTVSSSYTITWPTAVAASGANLVQTDASGNISFSNTITSDLSIGVGNTLAVNNGASLAVESGGSLTVESGGDLTFTDHADFKHGPKTKVISMMDAVAEGIGTTSVSRGGYSVLNDRLLLPIEFELGERLLSIAIYFKANGTDASCNINFGAYHTDTDGSQTSIVGFGDSVGAITSGTEYTLSATSSYTIVSGGGSYVLWVRAESLSSSVVFTGVDVVVDRP